MYSITKALHLYGSNVSTIITYRRYDRICYTVLLAPCSHS